MEANVESYMEKVGELFSKNKVVIIPSPNSIHSPDSSGGEFESIVVDNMNSVSRSALSDSERRNFYTLKMESRCQTKILSNLQKEVKELRNEIAELFKIIELKKNGF